MPNTLAKTPPDLLHYKKLNLGCGWDIREGFLNVDLHDFHKPDYVADILNLHELPSGHYNVIVAQDVLEHIERAKQVPALKEWARLLSAHGRLKVRLPSLFDMLRMGTGSGWFSAQAHAHLINMVYGTQAYNGDYHLAGHTALTLVDAGKQVSLVISHASVKDGWLFDVEFAKNTEELSNEEFVHSVYFEELGRPVDPSGLRMSLDILARRDRDALVAIIRDSAEWKSLRA
ncbi:MAG: methyltransferase domain-containing protein [Mesorhizobium sp.]|nr:MAG: methyltransferase domain-containing protein [Mesorhizobium sp.]